MGPTPCGVRRQRSRARFVSTTAAVLAGAMMVAGCSVETKQAGRSGDEQSARTTLSGDERQWSPPTWMFDLFNTADPAYKVKLRDIAIPGTHDSHTYKVGNPLKACGGNDIHRLAIKTARGWAKTQTDNIYDQARAGVRAFDIRPVVYEHVTHIPPQEPIKRKALSTCHTLEAATMHDLFDSEVGLNRFARENPKEVSIINLSHFNFSDYSEREALDTLGDFVNEHVCPRAIVPGWEGVPNNPGAIELQTMWKFNKQFVVGGDHQLYTGLKDKVKCMFELSPEAGTLRGGYAAGSKAKEPHHDKEINLWLAQLNGRKTDDWAADSVAFHDRWSYVGYARKRTEYLLVRNLEAGWSGLSESSYIWVYNNDNMDWSDAAYTASGSNLVNATRQVLWPTAANLIASLWHGSNQLGTRVNIVNMDAVERGEDTTYRNFINPLMNLNKMIAPEKPAPLQEEHLLHAKQAGNDFCVGTAGQNAGQPLRLVPCEVSPNSVLRIDLGNQYRPVAWQQVSLLNGLCVSKQGDRSAVAERCDANDRHQLLKWHSSGRALQSAADESKCLDVVRWEMGSELEFHHCHLGDNQIFIPEHISSARAEDEARLRRSETLGVALGGTKYCWNVDATPLRRQTPVTLAACDRSRNQQFERVPAKKFGAQAFSLVHRGMCLDFARHENPNAILYECHRDANQVLTAETVSDGPQKGEIVLRPLSDPNVSIQWNPARKPTEGGQIFFSESGDRSHQYWLTAPAK